VPQAARRRVPPGTADLDDALQRSCRWRWRSGLLFGNVDVGEEVGLISPRGTRHAHADALGELIAELEGMGLVYFDDFFELTGNWPEWLKLFAMGE